MKKSILILLLITLFSSLPVKNVDAYSVMYKEEFYNLYHIHYLQFPDDCIENIYWLERAARADFCNPQYVGFKIKTEKEWEKYRYLFMMHINLKLVEQHLRLGSIYDTEEVYFYDAPFKKQLLEYYTVTLQCYKTALVYWDEAKVWYEKANGSSFNFIFITAKQEWEDERERIQNGKLNYERTINREIARIEKNIEQLEQMDEKY